MSWNLQIYGHKPDGSDNTDNYADVKVEARKFIARMKELGHQVGPQTVNQQAFPAEEES